MKVAKHYLHTIDGFGNVEAASVGVEVDVGAESEKRFVKNFTL